MERLTVLYRRYVRVAVGVLSLLVTLLFSMDSLEYGKTLLNDSAYRSAIAAFAESGEEALAPIKDQCAPEQDTYACVTEVLSTPAFVKIFTHAPVSAEIPTTGPPVWKWSGGDWWDRLKSPSHWPGFLLTLVALLFGSSFWWDMLRRVTGLKSKTSAGLRRPDPLSRPSAGSSPGSGSPSRPSVPPPAPVDHQRVDRPGVEQGPDHVGRLLDRHSQVRREDSAIFVMSSRRRSS